MLIIQNSVDKLSNELRIFGETNYYFADLLKKDKEEAINNLDRAFDSLLEAFHSVYDVTKDTGAFDYFNNADTALLILLRNAIHHRDHELFTSLYKTFYLNSDIKEKKNEKLLLVSYENVEPEAFGLEYYFKIDDFYKRLSHKQLLKHSKKHELLFNTDLSFSRIRKVATQDGYTNDQLYINVMPILVSSLCKMFSAFKVTVQTPQPKPLNFMRVSLAV